MYPSTEMVVKGRGLIDVGICGNNVDIEAGEK
ncbi:unnamed protein product, partial [Rotaria sp. Silwood1]